jgi:hypothetical protein
MEGREQTYFSVRGKEKTVPQISKPMELPEIKKANPTSWD